MHSRMDLCSIFVVMICPGLFLQIPQIRELIASVPEEVKVISELWQLKKDATVLRALFK